MPYLFNDDKSKVDLSSLIKTHLWYSDSYTPTIGAGERKTYLFTIDAVIAANKLLCASVSPHTSGLLICGYEFSNNSSTGKLIVTVTVYNSTDAAITLSASKCIRVEVNYIDLT